MPLRRDLTLVRSPIAEDLRRQLTAEWQNPREDTAEPVIIENGSPTSPPIQLYVIWDAWGPLDQQERSEIIMEAYEAVRGKKHVLLVTLAMGLTTHEARRMGIQFT